MPGVDDDVAIACGEGYVCFMRAAKVLDEVIKEYEDSNYGGRFKVPDYLNKQAE